MISLARQFWELSLKPSIHNHNLAKTVAASLGRSRSKMSSHRAAQPMDEHVVDKTFHVSCILGEAKTNWDWVIAVYTSSLYPEEKQV